MNPYITQQLASQHEAELRRLAASSGHSGRVRLTRQTPSHRPRSVRRQAGWILISLGTRLAYSAGEE